MEKIISQDEMFTTSDPIAMASFPARAPETLQDCGEEFLLYIDSVKGYALKTVESYREDFKNLYKFLGGAKPVKDVSFEDLRQCVGQLSLAKYKATSINRFIASVRGLFAYCRKFNYISSNPSLELKTVKVPKHLPRFMTESEVDQLCKMPQENQLLWPERDTAIFEMLYSSGCRVSEIAALKLTDFENDYSSAIVTGKGNKDRRVFFEEASVNALKTYLQSRKMMYPHTMPGGGAPVMNVFINQKGKALTEHGIWYIVSKYSGEEGTKRHMNPHAFRHTFATAMLSNGADVRVVQEMLGHATISTTQRYTHISTERLKEVYKKAFPHAEMENNTEE